MPRGIPNKKAKKIAKHPVEVVSTQKDWARLEVLIENFADSKVNESWKGGGDPMDIPVHEAQLELSRARLVAHISQMRREREE